MPRTKTKATTAPARLQLLRSQAKIKPLEDDFDEPLETRLRRRYGGAEKPAIARLLGMVDIILKGCEPYFLNFLTSNLALYTDTYLGVDNASRIDAELVAECEDARRNQLLIVSSTFAGEVTA